MPRKLSAKSVNDPNRPGMDSWSHSSNIPYVKLIAKAHQQRLQKACSHGPNPQNQLAEYPPYKGMCRRFCTSGGTQRIAASKCESTRPVSGIDDRMRIPSVYAKGSNARERRPRREPALITSIIMSIIVEKGYAAAPSIRALRALEHRGSNR